MVAVYLFHCSYQEPRYRFVVAVQAQIRVLSVDDHPLLREGIAAIGRVADLVERLGISNDGSPHAGRHHRKIVARGGQSPRYLATSNGVGHLVYLNKARLFAIAFDLNKLETRGTAVPVLDDVAYENLTGAGQFDFLGLPLAG